MEPTINLGLRKLLIFFEQLEVDYVHYSLTSLKRTILLKQLLSLVMELSKTNSKLLMKKQRRNLRKTTKQSGGIYWSIWLNPYSICLSPSNLTISFGRGWRSSTELMMLNRKSMWPTNGCVSILLTISNHGTGSCLRELVCWSPEREYKDVGGTLG